MPARSDGTWRRTWPTRGHNVTLIEQDPAVLEIAKEWAPKVDHMIGDACEPWVLEKAQLNTADVVVASTG